MSVRGGFFAEIKSPAAFLGGRIQLSSTVFSLVLGAALVLASIRMLFLREVQPVPDARVTFRPFRALCFLLRGGKLLLPLWL